MKKYSDVVLGLEQGQQRTVKVRISSSSLRDWCLNLQLLQEHLAEACVFRGDRIWKKVEITVGPASGWKVVPRDQRLIIALTARDLDYVRHFFLRYYRDDAAEVDHIDIETDEVGYVVFRVDEFIPPVSSEEAKRRLGMA